MIAIAVPTILFTVWAWGLWDGFAWPLSFWPPATEYAPPDITRYVWPDQMFLWALPRAISVMALAAVPLLWLYRARRRGERLSTRTLVIVACWSAIVFLATMITVLALNYFWPLRDAPDRVVHYFALIGALFALACATMVRFRRLGFLGAWFFIILGPSSSVMPLADLIFEHRMYMPMAAVVTLAVMAAYCGGQWLLRRSAGTGLAKWLGGLCLVFLAVITWLLTYAYGQAVMASLGWEWTISPLVLASIKAVAAPAAFVGAALLVGRLPAVGRRKALAYACALAPLLALTAVLSSQTLQRNLAYASEPAIYEDMVKKRPYNARANSNLGYSRVRHGRIDEAVALLQTAIRLDGRFFDAYHNLAVIRVGQKKFDEAEWLFKKAIEFSHDQAHYRAYNGLGSIYMHQGKLKDAEAAFRRALQINPDYPDSWRNLGEVYDMQQRYAESINFYSEIIRINSSEVQAYERRGINYYDTGQPALAIRDFQKALELFPNLPTALRNYSMILSSSPDEQTRNPAQAMAMAQAADRLTNHNHPLIIEALAAAHGRLGNFGEALKEIQRAAGMAQASGDQVNAQRFQEEAKFYQAGKPLPGPILVRPISE